LQSVLPSSVTLSHITNSTICSTFLQWENWLYSNERKGSGKAYTTGAQRLRQPPWAWNLVAQAQSLE
jgi:hypothetical protein